MSIRWLSVAGLLLAAAGGFGFWMLSEAENAVPTPPTKGGTPEEQPPEPREKSSIQFSIITDKLGLDVVSYSGTDAEKHFPTANGTGVALVDYDQDGWLDLYVATGCLLDGDESPPNVLFRLQLGQSLVRAPDASGAAVDGFTQGVAAGDYNNDGFPDLYLVRYGPNILLENNGDGTFTDVSASTGLDDKRWGTSAAFLDYDNDGSPDLYVANYGKWDLKWHKDHPLCGEQGIKMYCSPKVLPPEFDGLFRCDGSGKYVDRLPELKLNRDDGRGQGVVTCDLNNDGLIDIYVANDLSPNFLFVNKGNGLMEDFTDLSCAAYNASGYTEAGMGVDAGDVDGDGFAELFVTNFYLEHNTLYKNLCSQLNSSDGSSVLFQDDSHLTGVADGSIQSVGWGTALEDLDGDSWLDIFVANGHVDDNLEAVGREEPYAQQPGLWKNVGAGKLKAVRGDAGAFFREAHVSRGVAFGDLDNDGDTDMVVSHKDERPTILQNDSLLNGNRPQWCQIQLIGRKCLRDAVGARVELQIGDRRLVRFLRGGKSYLSAHDLRLTIGLADADRIDQLTIVWPGGNTTVFSDYPLNTSTVVYEPFEGDEPKIYYKRTASSDSL